MTNEQREAIALLRHEIISPVLMEPGRAQMTYFRQLADREFNIPGKGLRRFSATTMKGWLYRYKKNGFPGLLPRVRKDGGQFRRISTEIREAILELRNDNPDLSIVQLYDRAFQTGVLGQPPVCMETLRRFLKALKLSTSRTPKPRKRFEMGRFGELWTADFMHGPGVLESPEAKRTHKAILMAIIDDHSRMIVGAEFGFYENTRLIELVFKDALLSFGVCDRFYCDNGPSFSSDYLKKVCAHSGIGLVHSKPYDSPSRGKIERWFRSVRQRFLNQLHSQILDLKTLNDRFRIWLRDDYHHQHHTGIDARPIDRYHESLRHFPIRRIDEDALDEFFMARIERAVNRDSTISWKNIIYEVPPAYIRKKIELRYVQDRPTELYLYVNGVRMQRILPVDSRANGQHYRPSPRDSEIALHKIISESSLTEGSEN